MKRILAILMLLCMGLTGCDEQLKIPDAKPLKVRKEFPTVNIPPSLRQENWLGSENEGCCVHATMCSLFNWQGRPDWAAWWKKHNGNGEWAEDLAAKFDRVGIKYAYTSRKGDVRFLEWACKTRRGCGVTVMGGQHMVALVHLDDKWAGILDNNHTEKIIWVPRKTFIAEWLNSSSWAVVPLMGPPAAPLPPK
jgi:hypothetical protein